MNKKRSLNSQGVKYKLIIAIALMSIIPLLVCLNYIFPSLIDSFTYRSNLQMIIAIIALFLIIGFIIIERIAEPLTRLSKDAALIAKGDLERHIEIKSDDEIGQLGFSLNQLNERIKRSMEELKDYGSRAAQLNLEIQKQVFVLSGLLQVSNMISQSVGLQEVLSFCVEKAKTVADSSVGFLLLFKDGKFSLRSYNGLDVEKVAKIDCLRHGKFLLDIFQRHTLLLLDASNSSKDYEMFAAEFDLKNCVCLPIFLDKKPVAILGVGNNRSDFTYKKDECDVLDIFAKQIAIALKNDLLSRRAEELEIKDALTGLYNENFIRGRLDEEIKRAIIYQRPCSFTLVAINHFRAYQNKYGLIAAEVVLKKIGSHLNSLVSEVDRVGRIGDSEFGIILPEKNKRQAKHIAEEIKKKIEHLFQTGVEPEKKITVSVAITENPLDGINGQELISLAQKGISLKQ